MSRVPQVALDTIARTGVAYTNEVRDMARELKELRAGSDPTMDSLRWVFLRENFGDLRMEYGSAGKLITYSFKGLHTDGFKTDPVSFQQTIDDAMAFKAKNG